MAKSVEVGQKIRIEGREFTVSEVSDRASNGKRFIELYLKSAEDIAPEDLKPTEFSIALNKDMERIGEAYTQFIESLAKDVEAWVKGV